MHIIIARTLIHVPLQVSLFGKRSEPSLRSWTGNFVLSCMAISAIYIFIYVSHAYTGKCMDDFTDSMGYAGRLRDFFSMDTIYLEMGR